jgi:microsomal dipeptidase-like Zn-dependent dipeptidase
MGADIYILIVAVVVLALVVCFFVLLPRQITARLNSVQGQKLPPVSDDACELHSRLFVADFHCDALMWNRDILERGWHGHVDLPRLVEGNVALQVFSAVTQIPLIPRQTGNSDRTDGMTLIAVAQRWPRPTWSSLSERALHQAKKLHDFAAKPDGGGDRLTVVKSAAELDRFVEQRNTRPDTVAGILLLEGSHALEGDIENLDRFYEAGYRIMGLVHLFDNEVGGSTHGISRGGLTEFGRRVVRRMDEMSMTVDLAHASTRLIVDALETAARPVVVTHTGVLGTCDTPRNLADDDVRRIAEAGGVIGIGFWKTAVCGTDTGAIVRAIHYVADLVGVDHVALGSDFDGAVKTPFDASGLSHLTGSLIEDGFSRDEIGRIMGGNALRLLRATLPRQ